MKDHFTAAADPLQKTHAIACELEEHILLRSAAAKAGDVVLGGYIARGKSEMGEGSQGKAKRSERDMLTQIAIDQAAQIEAQLAGLYDQRDDIMDRLNNIDTAMTHRQRMLGRIAEGNMPEIGEDGAFKDQELEALVAAHERKSGHSIDRSDPQAIAAIITADQQRLTQDRAEARDELKAINEKIDGLEAQADAINAERGIDSAGGASDEADLRDTLASTFDADTEVSELGTANRFDQFTP